MLAEGKSRNVYALELEGRLWLSLASCIRMAAVTTHRQPLEYLGGVRRFPVLEDKVPWSKEYPEYQPVDYTAPRVEAGPVWADPDIRSLARQQCIVLYYI